MLDEAFGLRVLNRNPAPDVLGARTARLAPLKVFAHQRATFGQELIHMMIGTLHRIEHLVGI